MDDKIELKIKFESRSELNEIDAAIGSEEGVAYKTGYENVDPVTGALIVAGVLAASRLIFSLWERFRGGTIIDLTKQPLEVDRNRDIPVGMFVIISKDGKVQIEAKDEPKEALERMVSGFLEAGLNATTETAKAIAQGALGGDKAVEASN